MCEWYEEPVKVKRDDKILVVPANEVQEGDTVWMGEIPYKSYGVIADDDEEVMCIYIDPINAWPAGCFASK